MQQNLSIQSAMLCRWKSSITHVVLPTLVRSVKSLAGMAGGCWILHADFVDACASAEAFMEPVSTATWWTQTVTAVH